MKKNFLLNKTTILAASAVALLGLSAVGSTSAAINATTNEAIVADFATSNVAVSLYENGELMENGKTEKENGETKEEKNLLGWIDNGFSIGKSYKEEISFQNGEDYDAYSRVIITKSWYNEEGKKDTTLNPTLIDLAIADSDAWIIDKAASTPERTVYYYKSPVAANADPILITNSLKVNDVITEIVTESAVESATAGTIQTTYNYDGKSFSIDVQVDEIQTHNAYDAARACWGVYLDIDENGNIRSVTHGTEGQTNEN